MQSEIEVSKKALWVARIIGGLPALFLLVDGAMSSRGRRWWLMQPSSSVTRKAPSFRSVLAY